MSSISGWVGHRLRASNRFFIPSLRALHQQGYLIIHYLDEPSFDRKAQFNTTLIADLFGTTLLVKISVIALAGHKSHFASFQGRHNWRVVFQNLKSALHTRYLNRLNISFKDFSVWCQNCDLHKQELNRRLSVLWRASDGIIFLTNFSQHLLTRFDDIIDSTFQVEGSLRILVYLPIDDHIEAPDGFLNRN